jgi:hypothetical protein
MALRIRSICIEAMVATPTEVRSNLRQRELAVLHDTPMQSYLRMTSFDFHLHILTSPAVCIT